MKLDEIGKGVQVGREENRIKFWDAEHSYIKRSGRRGGIHKETEKSWEVDDVESWKPRQISVSRRRREFNKMEVTGDLGQAVSMESWGQNQIGVGLKENERRGIKDSEETRHNSLEDVGRKVEWREVSFKMVEVECL